MSEVGSGAGDESSSSSSSSKTTLSSLESFLQKRIFSFLNLSSRSRLRQCCTALYRAVETFDLHDLANGGAAKRDGSLQIYDKAREDLVASTELKRWMTVTRNTSRDDEGSSSSNASLQISPGTPNLRRLKSGDFNDTPKSWNSGSNRNYPYYEKDPKLIDDHILVLYSDYYFGFEAFDLNSGKALGGADGGMMNGPTENYLTTTEHRALVPSHYDGRHGLLAAGLHLCGDRSSNPHGPWSGPYLTVWDLTVNDYKNVRMRLDLRKPRYDVCAVSVVAPDLCAVLLTETEEESRRWGEEDNDVNDETAFLILQWHRIPSTCEKMSSDPPPPPKPTPPGGVKKNAGTSNNPPRPCQKKKKKRAKITVDDIEYPWFPGSATLLQEDKVKEERPLNDCCAMHSDGKGILVVIAGDEVQFWHVGTMSLVRVCPEVLSETDGLDFSNATVVSNFTTHTIVQPMEIEPYPDSYEEELTSETQLAQNEPHYNPHHEQASVTAVAAGNSQCQSTQQETMEAHRPDSESTDGHAPDDSYSGASSGGQASSSGSVNKSSFDLVRCGTEAILMHFAHENSRQEREFEKGICGILGHPYDGTLIKRSTTLPIGSCSPQLQCVVRVVFSVHSQDTDQQNKIVVMDVEPFQAIRARNVEGQDRYSIEYAQACLGQQGLWTDFSTTAYVPASISCEQMRVFDLHRGGVFDFPEHGESEPDRYLRIDTLLDNIENDEERERKLSMLSKVEGMRARDRHPLSLHIDAHKLIICTRHEFMVWPAGLLQRDKHSVKVALHDCANILTMKGDNDVFSLHVGVKPLYMARPLDKHLCHRWDRIAHNGSDEQVADIQSIAQEIRGATTEGEQTLLRRATSDERIISDAVFSWRYAVLLATPTDSGNGEESLNIFDSLGDWARDKHSPFQAERHVAARPKDDSSPTTRTDLSKRVGISIPSDRCDGYVDESGCWAEYDSSDDEMSEESSDNESKE